MSSDAISIDTSIVDEVLQVCQASHPVQQEWEALDDHMAMVHKGQPRKQFGDAISNLLAYDLDESTVLTYQLDPLTSSLIAAVTMLPYGAARNTPLLTEGGGGT